jgi:hypothetical protein
MNLQLASAVFLAFVGFVPYVELTESNPFSPGMSVMTKPIVFVVMVAAMSCLQASSADAQVVTSFFAPPTSPGGTSIAFMPGATLTPAVVAQPMVVAQPVVVAQPAVIGTVPVRRGLFGMRTEHVPVFAGAPVMASSGVVVPASGMTTLARPINSPFVAARPVITSTPVVTGTFVPGTVQTSAMVPMVSSPVLPSATVQSGFRGTGPIMTPINSAPVIIAPAPTFPFNGGPFNTFTPGSVMTMQ